MKRPSFPTRAIAAVLSITLAFCLTPAAAFANDSDGNNAGGESTRLATISISEAQEGGDLNDATVTGVSDAYYTGSGITFSLTVTMPGASDALAEDVDYQAVYVNNVEVGTAQVTIEPYPGSPYTGSKTIAFNVLAPSATAVLMPDGVVYASTSAGAKSGNLASKNDAATVNKALASVTTLFVDSRVKSVAANVKVATQLGTVSTSTSRMTKLAKVVFLTSKAANAAAVSKATAAVTKATTTKTNADKKASAAKSKYTNLNKLAKQASTMKKNGSLGFFQYYAQVQNDAGAKAAIKALKRQGYSNKDSRGRTFTSFTHIGNAKDATSLANFERAVNLIPRGNKLRTTDNHFRNLSALKVSDVAMAMAQSHANWSDKNLDHARMNGSNYPVAENLAWNYGSDPFRQWYTDEKAIYDKKGSILTQTGHYENIVKPGYTVTGMAVCTYGSMYGWTTYSQEFAGWSLAGEKLYTVTQYKSRIATYKKFLKNAASQAKSAKKAYQKALATQRGAAGTLKAAKSTLATEQAKAVNACTSIGASAFAGRTALNTVTNFDKTLVTTIGSKAFSGCKSLTTMKMPYSTLKTVGASAFANCKKLKTKPSVKLSAKAKVAKIKAQSFKNGKAVKPAPVVKVGGKKLKKGTDYTLRYSNNYAKGTASVAIVGKGKYYGTKTVKFKIK